MDIIYEFDEEIIQMRSQRELLYLASKKEIIILSIRRRLKGKDVIKKRITIIPQKISDEFTQIYDDNKKGQVDFVKFAIKDNSFPLIHSSKIESRLISLNSNNPNIVDFDFLKENIIVLCNNGALIKICKNSYQQQLLIQNQIKAFAVNSDSLCFYYDNCIQLHDDNNRKFYLKYRFKDQLQYKGQYILLHSTQSVVCLIDTKLDQIKYIELQILQIQFLTETQLLVYLPTNQIIKTDLELKQIELIQDLKEFSYFVGLEDQIYLKNGQINKDSKIRSIQCGCLSYNKLLHILCGQVNTTTTYNIICLTNKRDSLEIIRSVQQLPIDLSDLLVYLHHYQEQFAQILELLLSSVDNHHIIQRKKKSQKIFKMEPFKYAHQTLLHLLITKENKQAYFEYYGRSHIKYLMKIPQTQLIQTQIALLQQELEKRSSLIDIPDKCPLCNENLIKWTLCKNNHKLMRCNITQAILTDQRLLVCKTCRFNAIDMAYDEAYLFDKQHCVMCGGQMSRLLNTD